MFYIPDSDCDLSSYNHKSCFPSGVTGCIDKELFNDGTVNCPFPYCLDENYCFDETKEEIIKDNTGIIVTAVTSLIFTIITVTLIFWLCFKFNSICFKSTRRHHVRRRPVSRDLELQTSSNVGLPIEQPQTVSTPNVSQTVVEDKDQPPPYESLFPER